MLDEASKRRENFDEANSVPIKLADSQEWMFPKPFLQIHASFQGGKAVSTWPVLTCGPELDAIIEIVSECKVNATLLCAAATLGAHMLLRQYSLDDRELDQLFAFRPSDPDSWDWVQSVINTATGLAGPKA